MQFLAQQPTHTEDRQVFTAKDLIHGGLGSRNFVYARLKDGSIPAIKLGDKYIIDPVWVRDVLGWH
jgi:hypothetical protein